MTISTGIRPPAEAVGNRGFASVFSAPAKISWQTPTVSTHRPLARDTVQFGGRPIYVPTEVDRLEDDLIGVPLRVGLAARRRFALSDQHAIHEALEAWKRKPENARISSSPSSKQYASILQHGLELMRLFGEVLQQNPALFDTAADPQNLVREVAKTALEVAGFMAQEPFIADFRRQNLPMFRQSVKDYFIETVKGPAPFAHHIMNQLYDVAIDSYNPHDDRDSYFPSASQQLPAEVWAYRP